MVRTSEEIYAATKRPAVLVIAEQVHEEKCAGYYDESRATWSNRTYELASTKKHCEDM